MPFDETGDVPIQKKVISIEFLNWIRYDFWLNICNLIWSNIFSKLMIYEHVFEKRGKNVHRKRFDSHRKNVFRPTREAQYGPAGDVHHQRRVGWSPRNRIDTFFATKSKEVWDNKTSRSPYNVLYDADGERPMRQRRIIPRKGGNPSYGSSRCIINLGQLLPSPTGRIKFVPSAPIGLTLLHKGLASNINPFLHIYAD